MASRLAVDIAIESLLENEVEEISRDGQEKYVPWVVMVLSSWSSEQAVEIALLCI